MAIRNLRRHTPSHARFEMADMKYESGFKHSISKWHIVR